jgi:ABC-type transport system substrate-binding protein
LQPRDYDVLVYEIELGSDPDQFVYWHSSQKLVSGLNFSNYSNANVDEVLATARGKAEPALRQAKYKTFINEWINDAPAIGLIQSNLNYAVMNGTSVFSSKDVFVNQEARFNQLSDFSVNQASVYTTP